MSTKDIARTKDVIVFVLNPSPKNDRVSKENNIIPIAKPISLPGHSSPSNPVTMWKVADINKYDTGNPIAAIICGCSLHHGQRNCPLVWNQIIVWPIANKSIDSNICFITYII